MATQSNKYVNQGGTALIAFPKNLWASSCNDFQDECQRLEEDIRRGVVRNVVVDCSHTNCFGCTALGLFVRLWKMASEHDGQFVMCCLSDFHHEMLAVMRLNKLWTFYKSRNDALQAVRKEDTSRLLLNPFSI